MKSFSYDLLVRLRISVRQRPKLRELISVLMREPSPNLVRAAGYRRSAHAYMYLGLQFAVPALLGLGIAIFARHHALLLFVFATGLGFSFPKFVLNRITKIRLRRLRRLISELEGNSGIHSETSSVAVPKSAQFLLLLVPKKNREALLGDLEEEFYTVVLPQYGPHVARFWYWEQVLCSLWPFLWSLIKRTMGLAFLWKRAK